MPTAKESISAVLERVLPLSPQPQPPPPPFMAVLLFPEPGMELFLELFQEPCMEWFLELFTELFLELFMFEQFMGLFMEPFLELFIEPCVAHPGMEDWPLFIIGRLQPFCGRLC